MSWELLTDVGLSLQGALSEALQNVRYSSSVFV